MKGILVFLLAALPVPFHAAATEAPNGSDPCSQAYEALPHGTILDLLDASAPDDRRARALAAYKRLATLDGCPEFGYTLAQLYRHGTYLPGNPIKEQDLPRARTLLLAMAENGYLPAYADLAELEMRHANPREAMKWTQVYLYFTRTVAQDFAEDADDLLFQRTAYNGNLLARVHMIWSRSRQYLPRKLIREDLNDYLSTQGSALPARVREHQSGMHRRASGQDIGTVSLVGDRKPCYVRLDGLGAASASWIIEVLPSGRTGRVVIESMVPHAEAAEAMKDCVGEYRFAEFEGEQSRTVRLHMLVGSTEGASLLRQRRR